MRLSRNTTHKHFILNSAQLPTTYSHICKCTLCAFDLQSSLQLQCPVTLPDTSSCFDPAALLSTLHAQILHAQSHTHLYPSLRPQSLQRT